MDDSKMELNTIVPRVGITHIEKPECKGKPQSEPLCEKNVEIMRVSKFDEANCPTCKDIEKGLRN